VHFSKEALPGEFIYILMR
jgi:hypothetical protein